MIRQFLSLQSQVTLHDIPEPWSRALESFWGRASLPYHGHRIDVQMGTARGGGQPVHLTWAGGTVVGQRQNNRISVEGQIVFEVGPGWTQIELGPEASRWPDQTMVALHLAMVEAHRTCGLLTLHAAVLRRGEQILAITGTSGAGKSTAALRLSQRGWSVVAEDTSWLTTQGEVVGWDEGLRLRPDSRRHFAPNTHVEYRDAHGKDVLKVKRAEGGSLSRVLVLHAGVDARLSGGALVKVWWEMTGLPLTPLAQHHSQRAVMIHLMRTPTWVLDRDVLIKQLADQ